MRSCGTCPRRSIRPVKGKDPTDQEKIIQLEPDPTKPFVGMAFKIVEDEFGQLTFMRIYQGTVEKGGMLLQPADRQEGALQPHREDARRQARGNRLGRGRRHRGHHGHRLRQRRHVLQRAEVLHAGEHVRRRAGDQDGDHAAVARRRRPAGQGPAAVPQGRPDVPGDDRRRDGRDGDRRHGRIAPGDLRRADSPRVQGRGRSRRAEGQLPRSGHQAGRVTTSSTRSRPAVPASTPTSSAR